MARSTPAELERSARPRERARSARPSALRTAALALWVFGLGACGGPPVTVTGTGPVVREMRTFDAGGAAAVGANEPTEVHLTGELDLSVHVGRPFAVWIDGHADLVGRVAVELEGGRLQVSSPRNTRLVPPPHIEVELPVLAALAVEGAGTARVVDVAGDALSLSLLGSGDIAVTGAVRRVTLELVGSGEAHLDGLAAGELEVDKIGSGVARVTAATALRGKIVGSGDLLYVGDPATVEVDSLGSGQLRRLSPPAREPETKPID